MSDVDFLRRRITLSRNAPTVRGAVVLGSLKGNKSRVLVVPSFVTDAIAAAVVGKGRSELIWPAQRGGYQVNQDIALGWRTRWRGAARPIRRFRA